MQVEKSSVTSPEKPHDSSKERLIMLSDGVFAIAITLLVIDIHLPEKLSAGAVQDAFIKLFPQFLGYVISFVIIATYWVIHRRLMDRVKIADRNITFLNLTLLFFIALLPVSTKFIGPYYGIPIITAFYALNLAACGFVSVATSLYLKQRREIAVDDLNIADVDRGLRSALLASVVFVLSLLLMLLPNGARWVLPSWCILFFTDPIARLVQRLQSRKA
ncbi:DUF1211 domain-containing protein [Ktedonosporobacter rubrisoli]|uniref:DUF1211 domain-containing protein n=1 Tax=Ktedonosporobacter rubrisoli TaxID=2509675 RepID=A0A4P6JX15_KTERU|nr:TMEM175 family protein [Ktedonosporobacter rubrisoli]QBD79566.1 DUF1211 domain-containing protein [Ktedonosporobacter rubrisoli]